MTTTNIAFTERTNGYDKDQVDNYIGKIGQSYQELYDDYQNLNNRFESLTDDYFKLVDKCSNLEKDRERRPDSREQQHQGLNPDIISKVLVDVELLARKIEDDARAEAAEIVSEAKKTTDEANLEAAKTREIAQKIISDAKTEAALLAYRAEKNIDQAQKTIRQAIVEAGKLLTFNTAEKPDGE